MDALEEKDRNADISEVDRVEMETRNSEKHLNEVNLKLKLKELSKPFWLNPLFAAILAAALAAAGNLIVTAVNADRQIKLEDRKAEQNRILEMLKTGSPDKAAENLRFLISTGLITDKTTLANLESYLGARKPGEGASLAASGVGGNPSVAFARIWVSTDISVCFENPDDALNEHVDLIRTSVSDTWGKHSSITFTGWSKCDEESFSVRIKFEDTAPHTKAVGVDLRGLEAGVVLNTKFDVWSPACKNTIEDCIKGNAVHSFGHVLGFGHEHNRLDAPPECRELAQGDSNIIVVGPYDPDSVMNYCNPVWNNGGVLSSGDMAKLATVYGAAK